MGTVTVEPETGRDGGGGLHIHLAEPPDGAWPDFHIYHHPNLHLTEGHRYRAQLWVRSVAKRSFYVEFYRPGQPFIRLGGPADPFPDQIKMAAEAGVDFVSFPVGLPWPKPGEAANWDPEDAACRTVLAANPHALLVPRIPMDPPVWWRAAHPDEVMQWEDGHRAAAVMASPVYRREAAERLAALVAHLEEKFGEHVAGYHPVGQNTGEWFYEDSWKQPLNGYAPADLREWRLWLQQRYASDDALRRAWNDPGAGRETAAVPTPAARHAAPAGIFRDPATEQALVDWAEFQQEAMADGVCALARAARQASAGKKLVLFFYGYLHEFGAIPNGPATSGHYALRRVLDSPDIDIVCSPISYFDRGLGGSAPSMSAAESVALAGKMWLNEDDTHTYLATGTPPGSRDHVTTLEATNAELTRNVAEESLRNFATWWMDLTFTGWFRDRGMWQEMANLKALDEPLLVSPTPFRPEIAAVVDAPSMWRVAAGGRRRHPPLRLRSPRQPRPGRRTLRPVPARRCDLGQGEGEALCLPQCLEPHCHPASQAAGGHARQRVRLVLRTRLFRWRPRLTGSHAGTDRIPPATTRQDQGLGDAHGGGRQGRIAPSFWRAREQFRPCSRWRVVPMRRSLVIPTGPRL